MNAHFADDIKEGDMAMIASSVDDPDNAKLYIRSNDTMKFLADLSGAQGIKGDKGDQGPSRRTRNSGNCRCTRTRWRTWTSRLHLRTLHR